MGGDPDSEEGEEAEFQNIKADMEGNYLRGGSVGALLRTKDKKTDYGRTRPREEQERT